MFDVLQSMSDIADRMVADIEKEIQRKLTDEEVGNVHNVVTHEIVECTLYGAKDTTNNVVGIVVGGNALESHTKRKKRDNRMKEKQKIDRSGCDKIQVSLPLMKVNEIDLDGDMFVEGCIEHDKAMVLYAGTKNNPKIVMADILYNAEKQCYYAIFEIMKKDMAGTFLQYEPHNFGQDYGCSFVAIDYEHIDGKNIKIIKLKDLVIQAKHLQ